MPLRKVNYIVLYYALNPMSQLCKTTQSQAPGEDHTRYNETQELTYCTAALALCETAK